MRKLFLIILFSLFSSIGCDNMGEFYVYFYLRKDNNDVFYIGKGKDRRMERVYGHNLHCKRIAEKYGVKFIKVAENLSEEDAYIKEKELIKHYIYDLGYSADIEGHTNKENPHYLSNQDYGGLGCMSGIPKSKEQKQKIRNSLMGHSVSDESKQKISQSLTGKKQSAETIEKRTKNLRGKNNPKYGTHLTSEQKNNITKKLIGRNLLEVHKQHIKNGLRKSAIYKGRIIAIPLDISLETFYLDGEQDIKKHGFSPCHVYDCCNGKRHTHKGYTFHREQE